MTNELAAAIRELRAAAKKVEALAAAEYERWMKAEEDAEERGDEAAMVAAQRKHERADLLATAAADILEELE